MKKIWKTCDCYQNVSCLCTFKYKSHVRNYLSMMLAGSMQDQQIKFEEGKAEDLLMLKCFEHWLRSSRGKKQNCKGAVCFLLETTPLWEILCGCPFLWLFGTAELEQWACSWEWLVVLGALELSIQMSAEHVKLVSFWCVSRLQTSLNGCQHAFFLGILLFK